MNRNDYDLHDPRSSKYWTHTGDVITGVYDPSGGGRESQQFLRRAGTETAHVSGVSGHASSVPLNNITSKYMMPQAYGPNEVQTQINFLGEDAAYEYQDRMTQRWKEIVNSPEYKALRSKDEQDLRYLQETRRVQRELVDEGKAVEYQLDDYGNHTGRYRMGKVIAASPGWSREEGRKFTNLNSSQGDADFETGRERLLGSNAYEGRNQPTQGMFTPINTEGLRGPNGEQVIGGGRFRYDPALQAVGAGPNDYYGGSRGGGAMPAGNPAPYVNPGYAAKFQEIMASRVQPGDLRAMAASARAHNAAHEGQNIPYFGDDNEAGREYLNR